ncbi:hypothetical protein A3D72_03060 [Candidatus Uhrbacteria bacterium RIFCSPHIGHO2_02_FULL_57_19]|uniref:Uncharacterized protein n=2 Tax=Parcubacteria group TaxID=1794811 RepID=A0A1F6CPE5_9BACT|nr:MAG: hypothetical protein A2704_03995 [Candidatus Kaiserbacteria bacterium RIFCSPHIGHO2_01_FULL_54_36b]OGL73765.1 MAG: hypothetical protein A3D72_03060 [Candidatus Uhrbacteria bacterium RIFCSPHIGHO2_02_FULL_57_19]
MPRKWSKEIVVRHILERHRGGKKLSSDYMQKNSLPLYMAAVWYWSGWRQAIEGAGLNYDDVRIKTPKRKVVWNEKIIVQTILSLHKQGEPLNSNHAQTKHPLLYRAAYVYFEGWAQAVTTAGLDYGSVRKKKPMRAWSKKAIVAEILRRSAEELSIRGGNVVFQDRGLYQAAKRHFGYGGWAKARMLAGFPPVDPLPWEVWSKETVVKEILRLHKNGVELNAGALGETYGYIRSAGEKYFGSWGTAIEAAGLDYLKICKNKPKGWWTKPRLIQAIQSLDKQGIRLSSKAIQKSHGDIFATAIRKEKFGSWSQAVEAAGIDYRKHCQIWSTKAWLRRMSNRDYKKILRAD